MFYSSFYSLDLYKRLSFKECKHIIIITNAIFPEISKLKTICKLQPRPLSISVQTNSLSPPGGISKVIKVIKPKKVIKPRVE